MLHGMAVCMTVLASGSRGNCTVFSSSCGSILVDAGLSCRETLKRMKAAGEDPRQLKAIVISHEHNDHVAGAEVLSRKLKIPVYMTQATYESWRRSTRDSSGRQAKLEWHESFQAGQSFSIGDIAVNPFTTCRIVAGGEGIDGDVADGKALAGLEGFMPLEFGLPAFGIPCGPAPAFVRRLGHVHGDFQLP